MKEYNNFLLNLNDGVLTATVNRPEVRNALNYETISELSEILDTINCNNSISMAFFTGSGDKAFVSGADISFLKERGLVESLGANTQQVFSKLEHCIKPTVALVNGYALGGGFEFALACDIRIATPNAKFGFPELNIGILPGAGGTQRIARYVGLGYAKDLLLTGKIIDAEEAYRIGVVTRLAPSLSEVPLLIENIVNEIKNKSPLSLRLTKGLVSSSLSTDIESGLFMETLGYALTMGSEDKNEGVSAFFEKRTPKFKGY